MYSTNEISAPLYSSDGDAITQGYHSAAIWVGFSESDYAKQENAGPLKVVLTFTGQTNSEVTLEVVPMTISSYLNMTGSLPFGVQGKDPAESGKYLGTTARVWEQTG